MSIFPTEQAHYGLYFKQNVLGRETAKVDV